MADIADVLAQAENVDNRRTATVRLLLRQDLAQEHADLEAHLLVARKTDQERNAPNTAPAIAQRIVDLEAEMEASKVTFVFQALSRREYVDLISSHPPTKKQLADVAARSNDVLHRETLHFNPETFPIALIARCCVDPVMTDDDVKRLERAVSDEQWSRLWSAATRVNIGDTDPKASRVAGLILRLSEQSATTAAPEESDAPTS